MWELSEQKEMELRDAASSDCIDDMKRLIRGGVNPNAVDEVCC